MLRSKPYPNIIFKSKNYALIGISINYQFNDLEKNNHFTRKWLKDINIQKN